LEEVCFSFNGIFTTKTSPFLRGSGSCRDIQLAQCISHDVLD